jgi:hypothetical protein
MGIMYVFAPGAPGPGAGKLNAANGLAINRNETQTKAEIKAKEQIFNEDKGNSYPDR